jgi:hypothetical protein
MLADNIANINKVFFYVLGLHVTCPPPTPDTNACGRSTPCYINAAHITCPPPTLDTIQTPMEKMLPSICSPYAYTTFHTIHVVCTGSLGV